MSFQNFVSPSLLFYSASRYSQSRTTLTLSHTHTHTQTHSRTHTHTHTHSHSHTDMINHPALYHPYINHSTPFFSSSSVLYPSLCPSLLDRLSPQWNTEPTFHGFRQCQRKRRCFFLLLHTFVPFQNSTSASRQEAELAK